MRLAVVGLLLLFCGAIGRAQAPEVGTVYKPGDTVRVVVTLKSPLVVTRAQVRFTLDGEPRPDQRGFHNYLDCDNVTKISDTEYEIAGRVIDDDASGKYKLSWFYLYSNGAEKQYVVGQDFQQVVLVRVENPAHVKFPEIKDVTVKP